ncbi:MAG: hypothetical protein RJB68_1044, partial [Pseudomonadota bacterium]
MKKTHLIAAACIALSQASVYAQSGSEVNIICSGQAP